MRITKLVFLLYIIVLSLGLSISVEAAAQKEVVLNKGGGTSDVIQNPSIHNLRDVIEEKYAGKDDLVVYQVPVYERYERGNLIVNHGWRDTSYNEYGYFPASKTTTSNLLYNAQRINEAN